MERPGMGVEGRRGKVVAENKGLLINGGRKQVSIVMPSAAERRRYRFVNFRRFGRCQAGEHSGWY